ncbi:MAG: hypothetical protein HN389_02435 [Clostridia bacterium]|jgi:hypothetical protein|nr:hypothetical protein [Clostridia bacterium]
MAQTYYVSLDAASAARIISDAVVEGSFTGECLDSYSRSTSAGSCTVMVFEKHYYRVSNRLTLTVIIDDFEERTKVHCVSGGGGQSILFNFDWGASGSFTTVVQKALAPYIV